MIPECHFVGERERERITPFQPHKADAGAAKASPGRSGVHNQRG